MKTNRTLSILKIFQQNYPEYFMEAAELGLFMIVASVATTILEYPLSPLYQAIPNSFVRLVLIGITMGATAIALIYSPWGKQSGAHFNPAVTLTFLRLGKMQKWDAIFYIVFQFIGGWIGLLLAAQLIRLPFTRPPINYIVTVPGASGIWFAFVGEFIIAFIQMSVVLYISNTRKLAPYTGVFAGCLVTTYVIVESPLSGFGMNPARTFASALPANIWPGIWLYFVAPITGMLLASEVYGLLRGFHRIKCAKLVHFHHIGNRCIHCDARLKKVHEPV
ncbi:MAG: aquaporin [Rhizonema sp. PD38]|nr:aquaporin [Rhizonema sp. PD38]